MLFSFEINSLTMCCTVLYYIFCWNLLLFEPKPAETSQAIRIIGGKDADETKYQYVVSLLAVIINSEKSPVIILEKLHRCTAAVLTPTWTITASHCFITDDLDSLLDSEKLRYLHVLRYGSQNTTRHSAVMDIIRHPAYTLKMVELLNDVALMRHKPITLDQYARLSAMDYVTLIGQEVTMAGYGITNSSLIENGSLFNVASDAVTLGKPLQLLDALIVQCGTDRILPRPGMCLVRRCNKLSGVCMGDSGGPMIHQSGVVGVNSMGSTQIRLFCNLLPHTKFYDPALVTPISPYIDWISSVIRNEVPTHSNQTKKGHKQHTNPK